jgi:hypothetical protein
MSMTPDSIELEDGSTISIGEAAKTMNMIAAGIDRGPKFFGQLLATFVATARTQGFELALRYNEELDNDKRIEGKHPGDKP